jgi:hypothetical protein
MNSLKRTSTVSTTTDPETGEIIEAVDPKAGQNFRGSAVKTGAPLIRSMLENLNPERDD